MQIIEHRQQGFIPQKQQCTSSTVKCYGRSGKFKKNQSTWYQEKKVRWKEKSCVQRNMSVNLSDSLAFVQVGVNWNCKKLSDSKTKTEYLEILKDAKSGTSLRASRMW